MTVIDLGNARVGAGIVTIGAVGVAATNVGLDVLLPTGVCGRSSEAGTDVGAFAALAAGFAGTSAGCAVLVMDLGTAFGVTLGGADFVVELFDVTFGGAFEGLEDDGLAGAFLAAFGNSFALAPFAVAIIPLVCDFGGTFALTGALDSFAFEAGVVFEAGLVFVAGFDFGTSFDLAVGFAFAAGFALVTALPLAAGLVGALPLATLLAGLTFVDFPLALVLVAVLALFAVANLISSAVFLLFSLPPVAGGGISKTRKSTETIGQKQRIIHELQLLEK